MKRITLLALVSLFLSACQKEVRNTTTGQESEDPSLETFLQVTGITNPKLKTNLDSLITRSKRHGWWDLCNVIYPMAGGTQATCKYNLKDARDLDAAFRITFLGNTWSFSSVSANPGDSGYGYTHFNPSIQIADPNSCHLSVYTMNDVPGGPDNSDIGAYDDSARLGFYISTRDNYPDGSGKPFVQIANNLFQGSEVNGSGFFLMTKTEANTAVLYRNSSLTGADSTLTPGGLPNLDLFLCNQNFTGVSEPYKQGFSQRSLSFVTIGAGITPAMEGLMYSDITDFVENK
jgi:hypothetical protein